MLYLLVLTASIANGLSLLPPLQFRMGDAAALYGAFGNVLPVPIVGVNTAGVVFALALFRLYAMIRAKRFCQPAGFCGISYVLAILGWASVVVAVVLLVATVSIARYSEVLGWAAIPFYGIAVLCLPVAFVVSEFQSLISYASSVRLR
jgi:hypothetical protein